MCAVCDSIVKEEGLPKSVKQLVAQLTPKTKKHRVVSVELGDEEDEEGGCSNVLVLEKIEPRWVH